MWKFKASKYKNAAAKIPKKEEWITGISASNIAASFGNHIQASAAYMAFNMDIGGGGSLGILPINVEQKKYTSASVPTIQAHSDYVTDMEFCPFDDFLLATASQDCLVKLWSLPDSPDVTSPICTPLCTVTQEAARVEVVRWNPVVENVLGLATGSFVKIYDTHKQQLIADISGCHGDQVQSLSWSHGGSLLVSACKDKKLRIMDARTGSVTQTVEGHGGLREMRCLWLNSGQDFILTTGASAARQREVIVRDTRNLASSLKTISYDNSTGVLIPLYDADTGMLFLAGKGDVSIRYLEVSDKEPYLTENSVEMVEQMKGACLLPKRAVDVMSCEVNRIYVLNQSSIIPVPIIVPRKSMRDFQSDLYPDTYSGVPVMRAEEWKKSSDNSTLQCTKISLDPAAKSQLLLRGNNSGKNNSSASTSTSTAACSAAVPAAAASSSAAVSAAAASSPAAVSNPAAASSPAIATANTASLPSTAAAAENVSNVNKADKEAAVNKHEPTRNCTVDGTNGKPLMPAKPKPASVFTTNQSKYRHIEGVPLHKSLNIENVRNVSRTVPGESDLFYANKTFCAVPLNGAGGLIAILKTDRAGRLPDSGVPTIQNSSPVCDFMWDPFNDHRIAVGCEDAKIRIWEIPTEEFTETLTEADFYLIGHTEKLYFVKFHPTASDILISGSYDMSVRIWNLQAQEQCIQLSGHQDTIFSLSWSISGKFCATSCKDGQIRIYEPRSSTEPISECKGLEGSRGGRLVWACEDKILVSTGFDRSSVRQVGVFGVDGSALASLTRVDLDTAPAILVPHYDQDSSVIFLTGRGDGTVRTFEVSPDAPYLLPLTDYKADGLHQALSFLPKCLVDVREVELCRAVRLTLSSIEPVSFRVPRVKKEYFQDDLYKDTAVSWEACVTAEQWLNGENGSVKTISLKPADMTALSEAPVEAAKPRKYENFQEYSVKYKTDEQKKEELISAMTNKLNLNEGPLPQDLAEGVDPDEWDD